MYINNTVEEISHLLSVNFDEAADNFLKTLDTVIEGFGTEIKSVLGSANLTGLETTAKNYVTLLTNVNDIIDDTIIVKSELNENISNFCNGANPNPLPLCTELEEIKTVLNGIDNNSKLDMDMLNSFDSIVSAIDDITSKLNGITDTIQTEYLFQIDDQINSVKEELALQNDNIANAVNQVYEKFEEFDISYDNFDQYLDMFSLALKLIGSVLTILVAIMILALIFGFIARPGEKIAKASGSVLRVCIGIFLILGVIFFLILVAFFTVGAFSERFVCQTLDDPEDSDIIRLIDVAFTDVLDDIFSGIDPNSPVQIDLTLTDLILGIQAGAPIYPLLQLNQILDVNNLASNWKTDYGINDIKTDAVAGINSAINELLQFQETFEPKKQAILDAGMAADDLLNPLISKIAEIDIDEAYQAQFQKLIDLQTKVIATFSDYYNEESKNYTFTLKQDFTETIEFLDDKFDYFANDGKKTIVSFFNIKIEALLDIMDGYLWYAVARLQCNIGATVPLGNIYRSTDNLICDQVIDPFNAGEPFLHTQTNYPK